MSHGCHDCGVPNGCICDETPEQRKEVQEILRRLSQPHKFRSAEDYRDHLPCGTCDVYKTYEKAEAPKKSQELTGDIHFDEVLAGCIHIMSTKGHDYMAGTDDRLYNFRQAAADLGITMREVLYVYMWKHLAAIRSYCATGEIRSEGLKSRISDAINYMLILYKISEEEE